MPRTTMQFVLAALGIGGSLALTMCGGGESGNNTTGTSCPNGICGPATGTGGTTGSSTTMMTGTGGSMAGSGGMMAGSGGTASSSGSATTSSSSSGSMCVEAWICGPWDTGGNGNTATRTCTDQNNCATMNDKPATTATLPALDENYFRCNVEPILDRKCSMLGCHGTETGRELRVYSRARLRDAAASFTSVNCTGMQTGAQCIGSNSCPCNEKHTATEWQRNYDAARGFALDSNGNPLADQTQSDLIQQPVVGGKSHAGIHLFKQGDADYATLLNWLNHTAAGTLPSCNTGNN